jgi:hypothetical protein
LQSGEQKDRKEKLEREWPLWKLLQYFREEVRKNGNKDWLNKSVE